MLIINPDTLSTIHAVIASAAALILVACAYWLLNNYINRKRTIIKLPAHSCIEDTKPIPLIRCLRKMIRSRKREIWIDVCNVEQFQYETYLVLCAQAEKAYDSGHNTLLYSTSSIHQQVRNILNISRTSVDTTFHLHLSGLATQFVQQSKITPQVETIVAKELRKIGIRDYYDLNTLVTEILGNALEHGIRTRNINWWMYHKVEKGSLKLIFVDMGTGIISSYRKAGIGRLTSDTQLIKNAISGKVGSSTRQPNRGRGLPQINEMIKNNFISDFILITNSVTLRYINDAYTIETHPNFVGTYYSWTVNKDNFLKWQTWLTSQKTTAGH